MYLRISGMIEFDVKIYIVCVDKVVGVDKLIWKMKIYKYPYILKFLELCLETNLVIIVYVYVSWLNEFFLLNCFAVVFGTACF